MNFFDLFDKGIKKYEEILGNPKKPCNKEDEPLYVLGNQTIKHYDTNGKSYLHSPGCGGQTKQCDYDGAYENKCDNTDDICKKQFYQQKYYSTNHCGIGAGNQPHCTIRDELACSSMTELGSHVNNLGFIDKHENNNWQTLCKICNPIIDTEETLKKLIEARSIDSGIKSNVYNKLMAKYCIGNNTPSDAKGIKCNYDSKTNKYPKKCPPLLSTGSESSKICQTWFSKLDSKHDNIINNEINNYCNRTDNIKSAACYCNTIEHPDNPYNSVFNSLNTTGVSRQNRKCWVTPCRGENKNSSNVLLPPSNYELTNCKIPKCENLAIFKDNVTIKDSDIRQSSFHLTDFPPSSCFISRISKK